MIADNGKGFDETAVNEKGGVGLSSMQERARQMGGELKIKSELGQGTTLTLQLPREIK